MSNPRAGIKGLSSPRRTAHSLKGSPRVFLTHPPWLCFSPSQETRIPAKSPSCSMRTSKLPAEKNSETGRKGNKRDPEMLRSRERPEEGKEWRKKAEGKGGSGI